MLVGTDQIPLLFCPWGTVDGSTCVGLKGEVRQYTPQAMGIAFLLRSAPNTDCLLTILLPFGDPGVGGGVTLIVVSRNAATWSRTWPGGVVSPCSCFGGLFSGAMASLNSESPESVAGIR